MTDISKSFPVLNFNTYLLKLFKKEGQLFVKDEIRKKNLVLTPEEWVRQHCVHFLNQELNYPLSSIGLEGKLVINEQMKRFDILVYNNGEPLILVECKAASIKIDQKVFDQTSVYNQYLKSEFLMITNGLNHFYFKVDDKAKTYKFVKKFPLK